RALRQLGPSTVTELMRAAGPEKGARRHYRQLLRGMLRAGDVLLDKKGRLSIPKPEVIVEGARPDKRERSKRGQGAAGAVRSHAGTPAHRHETGTEPPGSRRRGPGERPAIARFDGHARGFGFVNPTDGSR